MSEPGLAEKQHASAYGYFVAIFLSLVYTLNFLDRQVIATLAPAIQHDLHLSNTALGNLQGLFFALFYTVWGIPLAWLADRYNRVRIVAFACTAWSLFSIACGLAQTYPVLVAARMGVGVGEAGGSPPSYALLADYFPPTRRSTALAIYSLGVPFGTGLGAAIGALVAHQYGWRVAFFVVGAPGVLLALLTLVLVREPKRGGYDPIGSEAPARLSIWKSILDFLKSIGEFLSNGTLLCTGIGAGLSAFVGYGMLLWAPSLLQKNLHMPAGSYALYYGLVSATTGAIGTFGSGWLADRLATLNKAWYAWLPAIVYVLSLPFFIGFVLAGSWPVAMMFVGFPFLFNNMYLAPALAVVQNAVSPARRAISGAVLLFLLNLIGLGGGPTYVGWMSDHLKPVHGLSPLQMGLMALVPIILITVISHLISGWAIGRDTMLAKTVEGIAEPLAV
jgi:predicted MFS family arabinose efflux permease